MPFKPKGTFAFLTMDSLDDFCSDDHLASEPLEDLGWSVAFIPWKARGVDWASFSAVIIRSTWDYQLEPVVFLQTLEAIAAAGIPVQNPVELVRWNMKKTYLADLQQRGVPTVPTIYVEHLSREAISSAFRDLGTNEIVLKPIVGANADHAFRVARGVLEEMLPQLTASYTDRPFMAQPFRTAITQEGEFSLFFFDGVYSHSILKLPTIGDFRSQEEHGATIRAVDPEPRLLAAAGAAMASLPEVPLYARVDFIRAESGIFEVMEFELIEPSLYLRMDPEAPARFARALHRRFA